MMHSVATPDSGPRPDRLGAVATKGDHVEIEVDGRTVRVSNPDKVFFAERRRDQARPRQLLPRGRRGRAARASRARPTVLKRYPNGAEGEPFFQKRVPDEPARLAARPSRVAFPSGRHADELVPGRRRPPRLGGEPRLPRPQPVAGAPWPTSTIPTSCVSTSTRSRASSGPTSAPSRCVVREVLAEHGLVRLPEDVGLARHPRERAHRSEWDVRRSAPRRARAGPRGRAPHPGDRDLEVVEGGARRRRLPRLQPERARPHGRVRVLGAGRTAGRVGSRARSAGTRSPTSRSADFTLATVPARFAAIGDPAPRSTTHAYSLEPLLELAARDEREGLGDAPWPPHFRKQPGEARRVAPSRKAKRPDDQDEDDRLSDEAVAGHGWLVRARLEVSSTRRDPGGSVVGGGVVGGRQVCGVRMGIASGSSAAAVAGPEGEHARAMPPARGS